MKTGNAELDVKLLMLRKLLDIGDDYTIFKPPRIDDFQPHDKYMVRVYVNGHYYGTDIRHDPRLEPFPVQDVLDGVAFIATSVKQPACSWIWKAAYLYGQWGDETDDLYVAAKLERIALWKSKWRARLFRLAVISRLYGLCKTLERGPRVLIWDIVAKLKKLDVDDTQYVG